VLCVRCGYNARTGRTLAMPPPPPAPEAAVGPVRLAATLAVGSIVAVAGAIAWVATLRGVEFELGILAAAVGVLVGGSMRLVSPRGGEVPGVAAAAFAFLSLAIAKSALIALALRANHPLSNFLTPFDLLWCLLALPPAYLLARG
jgi:hypothetical protein